MASKSRKRRSTGTAGMSVPYRGVPKSKLNPRASNAPKRRAGSLPYIHDKLADRIMANKTLKMAAKFEAGKLLRQARQIAASPEALVVNALWTTVKSRLLTGQGENVGGGGGAPGFAPTCIMEQVHPPTKRNLVDNLTYHSRVELKEGETSRIIESAKERYPSQSTFVWKTGSLYAADMIFQCHGINQSGFWQPYNYADGTTAAPDTYSQVNRFMMNGKDVYKEVQASLPATVLAAANSMKDNEDLLFAVESSTNKFLLRNASELTPCVITAYLVQCKSYVSDKFCYELMALNDDWPAGYIPFATDPQESHIQDSETSGTTAETHISTDNTARLGFTPQMSTNFGTYFDVVDVFKSPVLNPGDQWDFTAKQYFNRPMSYQILNRKYGDSPDYARTAYQPGDYEILLQFQGAPGFANNEKSNQPFRRVATNSNPCMVTLTQSRSLQTRFQSAIGATMTDLDNFTANTVREIDTSPRVSTYFGDEEFCYRAVAMTETESRVANEAGIGEAMEAT